MLFDSGSQSIITRDLTPLTHISIVKIKLSWHPYLFAVYGVLATIASNIANLQIGVLESVAASLLASIIVVIALRLILRDGSKAGLISSVFILLIFSYGHVQTLTRSWRVAGFSLTQDAIMMPLWAALLAAWSLFILRRSEQTHAILSGYFNWVSLISIIFPILTIYRFNLLTQQTQPWVQKYPAYAWQQGGLENLRPHSGGSSAARVKPDIYYIILDAYTRDDILDELYGYDNRPFLDYLRSRGFIVAESSRANYTTTVTSLASSLNMVHINNLPRYLYDNAGVQEEWAVDSAARMLISNSRVVDFLKAQGYEITTFSDGYGGALSPMADQTIVPPNAANVSNDQILFNMLLWDTPFGRAFAALEGPNNPIAASFRAHRQNIIYILDTLPFLAKGPHPHFIFAHILAPHVPYVFGPNGEEIQNVDPFTLTDSHPGNPDNIPLYRGQVNYLNTLVEKAIDGILANSDTPPIIILQGDHSSKVYKEPTPPTDVRMKLLLPILNAYRLPGAPEGLMNPTITPVNTFRTLFNYFFDANLERLDDESYLLETHAGRVDYVDACRVYAACTPR